MPHQIKRNYIYWISILQTSFLFPFSFFGFKFKVFITYEIVFYTSHDSIIGKDSNNDARGSFIVNNPISIGGTKSSLPSAIWSWLACGWEWGWGWGWGRRKEIRDFRIFPNLILHVTCFFFFLIWSGGTVGCWRGMKIIFYYFIWHINFFHLRVTAGIKLIQHWKG